MLQTTPEASRRRSRAGGPRQRIPQADVAAAVAAGPLAMYRPRSSVIFVQVIMINAK